jgi:hypothetical protein
VDTLKCYAESARIVQRQFAPRPPPSASANRGAAKTPETGRLEKIIAAAKFFVASPERWP